MKASSFMMEISDRRRRRVRDRKLKFSSYLSFFRASTQMWGYDNVLMLNQLISFFRGLHCKDIQRSLRDTDLLDLDEKRRTDSRKHSYGIRKQYASS
jgi:hypothetical protein